MYSCARVQVPGVELVRADVRLRHCLLCCEMVVRQIRSVLQEARVMGAERFVLAGDVNLYLGMLREREEFMDFYGPFYGGRLWKILTHGEGGERQGGYEAARLRHRTEVFP